MRSTWTDSRLDDLREHVMRIDTTMAAGFARLDSRIEETNGRIDNLHKKLVQAMVALIGVIGVLLSILIGIVATSLL